MQRLREGNERFAAEANTGETFLRHMRGAKTDFKQQPFAIILGCSDSRVPVEIVFDQDLGDLFVIRVAGNIVAPSQLGSVEFAAERVRHASGRRARAHALRRHSRHPRATAPAGRCRFLRTPASSPTCIKPAVADLLAPELGYDRETLIRKSVRANVQQSVEQLRHGSTILEDLIETDQLLVVGAEYSLETGRVEFFDD